MDEKLFQKKVRKYRHYTVQNGQFGIHNKPIDQTYMDGIIKTYKGHVIPELSERHVLENFIFAISSANTMYERPIKFVQSLKRIETEKLYDSDIVYHEAKSGPATITKTKENIFEEAMRFLREWGGALKFGEDYLANPLEVREELVKGVKFVAHKTASFIYLNMGGKDEILVCDIHVCRQLANLGVNIEHKYTIGNMRMSGVTEGRVIPLTLMKNRYLEVEKEAIEVISNTSLADDFPVFKNGEGKLNGGLLTTLLWSPGTDKARGLDPNQGTLFDGQGFLKPYNDDYEEPPF